MVYRSVLSDDKLSNVSGMTLVNSQFFFPLRTWFQKCRAFQEVIK